MVCPRGLVFRGFFAPRGRFTRRSRGFAQKWRKQKLLNVKNPVRYMGLPPHTLFRRGQGQFDIGRRRESLTRPSRRFALPRTDHHAQGPEQGGDEGKPKPGRKLGQSVVLRSTTAIVPVKPRRYASLQKSKGRSDIEHFPALTSGRQCCRRAGLGGCAGCGRAWSTRAWSSPSPLTKRPVIKSGGAPERPGHGTHGGTPPCHPTPGRRHPAAPTVLGRQSAS